MSQAKHDTGKPKIGLVPPAILEAVAHVRMFGVEKYKDPENWRVVDREQYEHALLRHLCEWMRDKSSVDVESGLPHLWHVACNVAFILEMERTR